MNLPRLNFEKLRGVDGVVCFLRGANYGPLEFPAPRSNPYFAKHERRQSVFYEQIHHLRGQLRKIMPKGRKARVSIVDQAERGRDSLSAQIKSGYKKSSVN
ncbi:hypothetical protein GOC72_25045 [Sinorhizobium medicae]|nr:hypothetical protein [Sinorhizobium medicae]MDX0517794.1 hypothetical protein [Sinorhizobium medicae]MDX0693393.1 hypothetical protein [Sinorhizobium medicae]MDX0728293.1 hypothetical protein [Sinorhizobium medicae]MDX0734513.1 hypothetical protein [Sinorhizobium medicae]